MLTHLGNLRSDRWPEGSGCYKPLLGQSTSLATREMESKLPGGTISHPLGGLKQRHSKCCEAVERPRALRVGL